MFSHRMTLLKTTTSVCSRCLEPVAARVVERGGEVLLEKSCPRHGDEEALLASDARLYWNAGSAESCGQSGCCSLGHSCTLIFEIAERCNLTCPTCFTASSPHRPWQMSLAEFEGKLDSLLAGGRDDADIIQISGGEPTIHPDIEAMIAACLARGMKKVFVNTNGVRLGQDPDFARRLADLDRGENRVQFYLQFDGFRERTHSLIRGAKGLYPVKRRALDHLLEVGLFALPVMTVTAGVNLDEIGDVIRLVAEHHPRMNSLILQPAFYAGRHDTARAPRRLTTSEVIHEVARQSGIFAAEDFGPIPCGHPGCFALAVAIAHEGRLVPVSRYFPRFDSWQRPEVATRIEPFVDRMPQHMADALADDDIIDSLLDLLAADDDESIDWRDHRRFFLVGIKPFMDSGTYDADRVARCCVHVVDRAGRPVSLCEYNTLRRPRGLL